MPKSHLLCTPDRGGSSRWVNMLLPLTKNSDYQKLIFGHGGQPYFTQLDYETKAGSGSKIS